jgi:hypothetical protein
MDLAFVVDEAIASQVFVQMIQQSIAYAIHTSHAGSIGTTTNVYSGSAPLSTALASNIGQVGDYFGRDIRAFLGAEVGLNIPSLTFELIRGGNRRIEEIYGSVISDIKGLLNDWNDLALDYYRHWHTMARSRFEHALEMRETTVERAYSLIEQVGNEHLARINEQIDTLEGARQWFESGFLSEDELKDISVRVKLEAQASELNYDEYIMEIDSSISRAIANWDTHITNALNDLTDNETAFCILIRSILDKLFSDVVDFVNTLANYLNITVEDVCAYRNSEKLIGIKSEILRGKKVEKIVNGGFETGDFTGWQISMDVSPYISTTGCVHSGIYGCVLPYNYCLMQGAWIKQTLATPIDVTGICLFGLWAIGLTSGEESSIEINIGYTDGTSTIHTKALPYNVWTYIDLLQIAEVGKKVSYIKIASKYYDVGVDDVTLVA